MTRGKAESPRVRKTSRTRASLRKRNYSDGRYSSFS